MHKQPIIAISSLILCVPGFAQEADPPESSDTATLSERVVEKLQPLVIEDKEEIALDSSQDRLEARVLKLANDLDDYFDDDNGFDRDNGAQIAGRWRLEWEPRSRDLTEFGARFKLKVRLPSAERRFDLFFSDVEDEAPDSSIKVAREALQPREERINMGLRFQTHAGSRFSHRLGIGRRAQLYVKSRYEDGYSVSDQLELKWTGAAYYYSSDRFSSDLGFSVDYSTRVNGFWRYSHQHWYRQDEDEWFWDHSLQYFEHVDEDNALTYRYSVQGRELEQYKVELSTLSVRWRFNSVRDWLFFELEPFVAQRRDEDFSPTWGIGLRVDGYFGD